MVIAGDETQYFEVLDIPFTVSAQSFFQANTFIAERMIAFFERYAPQPGSGGILMDLYSGVGLFSRFFADRFDHCVAIESSPSAVSDYVINLDEYDHIEVYEGFVEDILPSFELNPDMVIMDPPRAGIDASVVDWLAERKVPLVAYVSCDPSTLARDVKRLVQKGYSLAEIAIFDQFPQTYHIETISILTFGS
jgi:23S rRNA (uracil1939-C5)-methyltransferase